MDRAPMHHGADGNILFAHRLGWVSGEAEAPTLRGDSTGPGCKTGSVNSFRDHSQTLGTYRFPPLPKLESPTPEGRAWTASNILQSTLSTLIPTGCQRHKLQEATENKRECPKGTGGPRGRAGTCLRGSEKEIACERRLQTRRELRSPRSCPDPSCLKEPELPGNLRPAPGPSCQGSATS